MPIWAGEISYIGNVHVDLDELYGIRELGNRLGAQLPCGHCSSIEGSSCENLNIRGFLSVTKIVPVTPKETMSCRLIPATFLFLVPLLASQTFRIGTFKYYGWKNDFWRENAFHGVNCEVCWIISVYAHD